MRIVEGYQPVKELLSRQVSRQGFGGDDKERVVRDIIAAVRERGDNALIEFTEKFDGVKLTSLEVDKKEIKRAAREVDAELLTALKLASERISDFHKVQKDALVRDSTRQNLGWMMRPLQRVGVHAPGFTAPLPSSVLMTAIPARVAGVGEVVMTVPTPGGMRNPLVLAAAHVAGVQQGFAVGGAQAVAALAFGTATVPRVDKIVGPGGTFVAAAKRLVFGAVGIDIIAGPSEVLIVADGSAPVDWMALDLFSQAEHDAAAQAILLCPDPEYLDRVAAALVRLLPERPRADIIRASLEQRGALVQTRDLQEAVALANRIAPEHLELAVADPDALLPGIRHAGAIFVGAHSPEVMGDYAAGPSHVLPTFGTARFSSPLGVYDFQKRSSVIRLSPEGAEAVGRTASVLARGEGLEAHALAAEARMAELRDR